MPFLARSNFCPFPLWKASFRYVVAPQILSYRGLVYTIRCAAKSFSDLALLESPRTSSDSSLKNKKKTVENAEKSHFAQKLYPMPFPHPPGYFSLHPDTLAQLFIGSKHDSKMLRKSDNSHPQGAGLCPPHPPTKASGRRGP